MIKIGVLSLQGAIEEHVDVTKEALRNLGVDGEVLVVNKPEEIEGLDGLIIPGGESTVFGRTSSRFEVFDSIRQISARGMPIFGTCAGLIVLAKKVFDRVVGETSQRLLSLLDAVVLRNYFGRQHESFEADLHVPILGEEEFRGVFIRSPVISSDELGEEVKVVAKLEDVIVAVKQENILATAFHPELSSDTRFHEYFLRMILQET